MVILIILGNGDILVNGHAVFKIDKAILPFFFAIFNKILLK